MEEVKQSLQQKQENYKTAYLQKRTICNRQSVYISGEIQKRIMQIVGVITGKQVSIGNFIDNVLEEHLNTHNDVLSALYREEMQKGIFNQPKEKNLIIINPLMYLPLNLRAGRFSASPCRWNGFAKRIPVSQMNGCQVVKCVPCSVSASEVCRTTGIAVNWATPK